MYDIYCSPEKFGLTIVAEWDFSDRSYCFDKRVVWRNMREELLTARESGCSCPSPFEDKSIKNLVSVSMEELKQEAIDESKKEWYEGDNLSDVLEKIRNLTPVNTQK